MHSATILRKAERLRRCVERVREEYAGNAGSLATDFRLQDSVILNVQRACEQAIDIAQSLVAARGLARPADNGSLFTVLGDAGVIETELAARLKAMVGFRNIAVHEYEKLNLDIVRAVIERELDGLLTFAGIGVLEGSQG